MHPPICQAAKFCKKKKKKKRLNLGQKMPYFGIFGLEFEKLLSYFKSAPSNFSNCEISAKNPKYLNLRTFGQEFDKTIVISETALLNFSKISL